MFHLYFYSFHKLLKHTRAILTSRDARLMYNTHQENSQIVSIHAHQPQSIQHCSLQHRAAPHLLEKSIITCFPTFFPSEKKGDGREKRISTLCVRAVVEQRGSIRHRLVKNRTCEHDESSVYCLLKENNQHAPHTQLKGKGRTK